MRHCSLELIYINKDGHQTIIFQRISSVTYLWRPQEPIRAGFYGNYYSNEGKNIQVVFQHDTVLLALRFKDVHRTDQLVEIVKINDQYYILEPGENIIYSIFHDTVKAIL